MNCPSSGLHRGLVLSQASDKSQVQQSAQVINCTIDTCMLQKIVCDSYVMYQLDTEDSDVLIVTYTCSKEAGDGAEQQIVAKRKFRRCKEDQMRKISVI